MSMNLEISRAVEESLDEANLSGAIAIIGMSCRFPDAPNPEAFWQNLKNGVESVRRFTQEDLLAAGIDPAIMNHPSYVNSGVVLEGIDMFDAAFFGLSPRDAEILDPQQRLFLECCWEALEDAGYDPETYDGLIGVYGGADMSAYLFNLYSNPEIMASAGAFPISLANDKDHVTTRVAYKLNLRGPAVTIQTTCSTSLVAIYQACQSLLHYQSDIVLAGGTAITLPQRVGYVYQEGGIASPDGHCRAFDAQAQGTIGGSGVGLVVLKRYAEAIEDGDNIRAVLLGYSVNNDGALKVGYTAPSIDGQAEAIAMAQAMAGVHPETITYIEAHGTGTPLGDPIEVAALTQVFRNSTPKSGYCGIGSVKTNFGHLNSAAGVASLIKTVLALEHRMLPPNLHFSRPNPNIDFTNSPFYVVDRLRPWESNGRPLRAGVSSFGIGGTNAHVIVEEAPPRTDEQTSRAWQLLILSAKSASALDKMTANLGRYLKAHRDLSLEDVAYTLQIGRCAFKHRRMMLVNRDARETASDALVSLDPRRMTSAVCADGYRPIVFMFSGQGSQYVNMGAGLYRSEPAFREEVDRCCELLQPLLQQDLRRILYPRRDKAGAVPGDAAVADDLQSRLMQTAIAQPALFVIEYALARLWMRWGIKPQAMVGHSIGEFVAGCLAGVFTLEDALKLVAARAAMMQAQPRGAMLSVHLPADEVTPMLGSNLWLAAINGPSLCVVSGASEAVEQMELQLSRQGHNHHRLLTSHAFHSGMLDPIVAQFTAQVKDVALQAPQIPYLSNTTGDWITPDMATDPSYWGRHLRQSVQFARSLEELTKDEKRILLEVGPGKTLGTLASQYQRVKNGPMVLGSLPHPKARQSDVQTMQQTLGQLWLSGVDINWPGYYRHEKRRRVSLPTYPFEHQRYWVAPYRAAAQANDQQAAADGKAPLEDWFFAPDWQRRPAADGGGLRDQRLRWLICSDAQPLARQLGDALEQGGQAVVTVTAGDAYRRHDSRHFTMDMRQREHYGTLLKDLKAAGHIPNQIVHWWCASTDLAAGQDADPGHDDATGFFSLLYLAQALAEQLDTAAIQIRAVTSGAQRVIGDERIFPERAMLQGACRVIAQELPQVAAQAIDVAHDAAADPQEQNLIGQLLSEFSSLPQDPVVALRRGERWVRTYTQIGLEAPGAPPQLRPGGVYLITGGLSGIGLVIAAYLARAVQAKLVLIGRSELPPRDQWPAYVSTHDAQDPTRSKIDTVRELEQLGAQVLTASADVTRHGQITELKHRIADRFGNVHGIVHAAGVAGGGIIPLKTEDAAARVMNPKVIGTRVLEAVFAQAPLDFIVLCSSLSAMLGGYGQIDYCAANCFLDAFAQQNRFQQHGAQTVSINWDTWSEVGMAVNTEVPEDLKHWQKEGLRRGIRSAEGVAVFERVLGSRQKQIAVSTTDLHLRIRQATEMMSQHAAAAPAPVKTSASHSRPQLSVAYVAPGNRTEESLAALWSDMLGIESVGVNDNFLELGGHSLLATQMVSRIRDTFQVELSVKTFFEAPTVAELAQLIAGKAEAADETEAPISQGPSLVPLPRDQYRTVISDEGEIEIPEIVKQQLSDEP